ncbi:MAG TPA: hypothetical protein VED01_03270 [Burkholderiales bacterium]|nr:hypothetical protein [Burkholderiales bacterium]
MPLTTFQLVLALSAGKPFFTFDNFEDDEVDGELVALVDWNNPAIKLEQGDDTKRIATPAAHADFGGALCGTFTGVEWYPCNNVAAYNFAHDGSGMTIVPVYTRTNAGGFHVICASNNFLSTSNRGLGVAGLANGNTQAFVGTGSAAMWNTTSGGATAADVPTYRDVSWQKAANAWNVRNNGTLAASGTTPNTPSALDPVTTMTLGAAGNGTLGFVGRIAAFPSFPWLDASGRALVQQWINEEYGIAA